MKKVKRIVAIMLICILSACIFAGCKNQEKNASPDEAETIVETSTEEEDKTFDTSTKFATLKYSERWKDIAQIDIDDGEPYTVSFSVNGAKAFDLIFNGEEGDILGTLFTDDGQYLVRVLAPMPDESSSDYENIRNMQEDINTIINNFAEDYDFVPGVDVREEEVEVYAISTDLTDLYYPVKWQDKVTTEVLYDRVNFSCAGTPLFDIVFGGDEGIYIGNYDGTDIFVIDYLLEDDEMKNMQEDVNVILSYLQKDDKFVLA